MCFSSSVGIEYSRHIDDLDEEIRELSSGRSIGVKDSGNTPGHMGVSGVVSVRGTGSGKKVVDES